jgi:branched-chain amino acid aminotransferase
MEKPGGMHLMGLDYIRESPEIKTLNYIIPIKNLPQMKAIGADDYLYHHQGLVTELSRSNIFIVKNQTIITPNSGVLYGVTRKNVLLLAKNKYQVEERAVTLQEVLEADEVFTTGSTKKITFISKIDQTVINHGQIGEITKSLLQDFQSLEQSYYK